MCIIPPSILGRNPAHSEILSMDISIIIVNHNAGKLLQDCVDSVKQRTLGVSFEIIIVDNASTDGSCEFLNSEYADVKVVRSVTNVGFGRGNNLGMQKATGKYIFLLNPDTALLNNAVKIMFDFMEHPENLSIAVCGSSLYDSSKKPAISFGRFPTPCSLIFYSIPLSAIIHRNDGLVLKAKKEFLFVDYVSGADYFVRREVIDEIGQFDENFFAYYDETDLAKRISAIGYKSVIVTAAAIMHLEGKCFKNSLHRRRVMFESSLYYMRKFYPNKTFMDIYCVMNETKFKIYKMLASAENASLWNEMITTSKSYRTRSEL